MFENPPEFLMRQMHVASHRIDYAPDGVAVASLVFRGDPHLVREMVNRFAEESEAGRVERESAATE